MFLDAWLPLFTRLPISFQSGPRFLACLTYKSYNSLPEYSQIHGFPYLQEFSFPRFLPSLTRLPIPYQCDPRFLAFLPYNVSISQIPGSPFLQFPSRVVLDSGLPLLRRVPISQILGSPTYKTSHSLPERSQITGCPYLEEFPFPSFWLPLLTRLPIPFQSGPDVPDSPYLEEFPFPRFLAPPSLYNTAHSLPE